VCGFSCKKDWGPGPRPPVRAFCGWPCLIPMRDAPTCCLPFTSNIPSNGGNPRKEASMKPPEWEDREHASIEGLLFSLDSCLTSSDLSVIYAVLNFPTGCVTANQPLAHRTTTPNRAIPNKVGGRPPTATRQDRKGTKVSAFGLSLSLSLTHPASLLLTQPLILDHHQAAGIPIPPNRTHTAPSVDPSIHPSAAIPVPRGKPTRPPSFGNMNKKKTWSSERINNASTRRPRA